MADANEKIVQIIDVECKKHPSEEIIHYPSYWTTHKQDSATSNNTCSPTRVPLAATSELYKGVEKMLLETWEPTKIGHGNDAANLSHSKIVIRNIWCIENPALYQKYLAQKKIITYCAKRTPFPMVNGLKGEWQVKTHTRGMCILQQFF